MAQAAPRFAHLIYFGRCCRIEAPRERRYFSDLDCAQCSKKYIYWLGNEELAQDLVQMRGVSRGDIAVGAWVTSSLPTSTSDPEEMSVAERMKMWKNRN